MRIVRWVDTDDPAALLPAIDAIFFASSGTTAFAGEDARAAFRERWLGRYLSIYPDLAFVALGAEGRAIGYVVGATDDPARTPLFSDIAYFADLAAITAEFPAHLHINVAPGWRGSGIGRRLMEAFVAALEARGIGGVHIVTSRGMRNVEFYRGNGFAYEAEFDANGRGLVLLGRRIG